MDEVKDVILKTKEGKRIVWHFCHDYRNGGYYAELMGGRGEILKEKLLSRDRNEAVRLWNNLIAQKGISRSG